MNLQECIATIKKAECQRINAFELSCWRRFLRVPWTARRSNQSNLKEISPEYSLEGLMLKLKLQYFGHLMRTDSLEKTLMLGKIEGRSQEGVDRGWDGWMAVGHHWGTELNRNDNPFILYHRRKLNKPMLFFLFFFFFFNE